MGSMTAAPVSGQDSDFKTKPTEGTQAFQSADQSTEMMTSFPDVHPQNTSSNGKLPHGY